MRTRVVKFSALLFLCGLSACAHTVAPPHVTPDPPLRLAHQQSLSIYEASGGFLGTATATITPYDTSMPPIVGSCQGGRCAFDYMVPPGHLGWGYTLDVEATGYTPWFQRGAFGDGDIDPAVTLHLAKIQPLPQAAYTLPTCSSCPTPTSYDVGLPWTPPQTRDYLRADAWGVVVPELPFVTGGSSEHPERLLTGFLYKYDRELWDTITRRYLERGYTHFILWWPNARDDGGWTIPQFVAMCQYLQSRGLYVQVGLNSKDYDPRDQTPEQWKARLDPLFDALAAAHAADEFAVWEWDSHNVPGPESVAALKYMGQRSHAQGASFWLHFYPEHTSWPANGDPRGRYGFYDDLGTDIDGLQYQSYPLRVDGQFSAPNAWDIGELQSRIADTLVQFARQGNRHKFRLFETTAYQGFSGDRPTDIDSAMLNYLGLCTKGPTGAYVWGFGGGAWLPSGEPIP